MRIANIDGRLGLLVDGRGYDVESVSAGRFGADPQAVFDRWDEFRSWAGDGDPGRHGPGSVPRPDQLGAPVPRPRQIFAVGLNYSEHATESGFEKPQHPVIFTKFASSLTGPYRDVVLPEGNVDWEVELVAVVGRGGRAIPEAAAWDHIAGLTVGQDLSERRSQHSGPAPQFSLAKSHAGFSPIGPSLVTADELDDPSDLALGCSINGETVQEGRTSQLIFSVPDLIARLSRTVELYPGDVIFTGTPAGVGVGRTPPRFLAPGDVLRSYVSGVGEIEQRLVSPVREPVAGRV